MVGGSDERVGLPVGDINPPGETILRLEDERVLDNLPELLFIISVVGTVNTVRHSGLATQSLLASVHSLLEPGEHN